MERNEPAFAFSDVFNCENGGKGGVGEVITCVTASVRFIAVGTSRGGVWILDLLGNVVSSFEERHSCRVSGLCFGGGRFDDAIIASVGRDDGQMIATNCISGVSSSFQEIRSRVTSSSALNAVAIDPEIDTSPRGKRFAIACSDGKVRKRSFHGNPKE